MPGQKKRDKERAGPAGKDVTSVPHSKIAEPKHEDIASDEIEKAPQDVDGRRREPFPRRSRERALERPAHHPADEMWYAIRKKGAAKKIRCEMEPGHVRESALQAGQ